MKKGEKEIKSFHLEVKDMNDRTGEVSFYFAAWSRDQEKDTFAKSAYTKTFKENLSHVYHNRDHKDACGKPSNFGTDENGAFCTSQLAIKTIIGNDTYEQYKAGLIKGHSQEYKVIGFKPENGGRYITEVQLWGVTSVTNIPANLDATTISVKSFDEVASQMKKINDLLHNGNPSDELGQRFCVEYKRLAQFMETKSQFLKDSGVVMCDNCKTIIFDDITESENQNAKCKSCGRFVNKKSGAMIPIPILSEESLKNFKLF